LQKGFAANGAWLNAIKGDLSATGKTLTVDGQFVGDNAIARKLALYDQTSTFVVTKRYTLTVDKIEVNSPGFYISNGTVKGDVYVNASGFHGQTGTKSGSVAGQATIDGNLIFASQALLDAYNKDIAATPADAVKVTGQTKVVAGTVKTFKAGGITVGAHGNVTYLFEGNGTDTKTGATTGTTDATTLTSALGKNGAWLVAINGDVNAKGKTLTVDGTFLNEAAGVQRTLAFASTNSTHQITKTYTLTVDKLIVNSPATDMEGGNVTGDVYVGKDGSFASRGMKDTAGALSVSKITGNLYFATEAQLTTYNALPAAQKFQVSGTVGVKTAS
jgi:hypothetical protein